MSMQMKLEMSAMTPLFFHSKLAVLMAFLIGTFWLVGKYMPLPSLAFRFVLSTLASQSATADLQVCSLQKAPDYWRYTRGLGSAVALLLMLQTTEVDP